MSDSASRAEVIKNAYPPWSPRFWHGMRTVIWWRLLAAGRFRVFPTRWAMALIIGLVTPWNDLLAGLQWLIFGRKLARTKLAGPPIFILGHWRSGTTLLHELLIRDPEFAYPTTYQCFAPHHFLITEWGFRLFGGWLLPRKRPMDDMDVGWDRPQEDEFALLNLGLPSPYRRIAFCMQPPVDMNYLDWRDVSDERQTHWVAGLRRFLRDVTCKTPKPIVLKSPTHTGRIALLAKAFPDAKFIHIARDPRALLPSTLRLWRSLDDVQSLQRPRYTDEELEHYVIECGQRMFAAYDDGIRQVDPKSYIEIRYEDLVASPVSELRRIYEHLKLGDFSRVEAQHEAWAASQHRQFRANRNALTAEQDARIRNAWQSYYQRFGYASENPAPATSVSS